MDAFYFDDLFTINYYHNDEFIYTFTMIRHLNVCASTHSMNFFMLFIDQLVVFISLSILYPGDIN